MQSDLSAVCNSVRCLFLKIKKKNPFSWLILNVFQSAGIVGGVDAGRRKKEEEEFISFTAVLTFSSGCRLRLGEWVGVIQPIWVRSDRAGWFLLISNGGRDEFLRFSLNG